MLTAPTMPDVARLDRLSDERYAFGTLRELFGEDFTAALGWREFQAIFDALAPDLYMADGGKYRQRRFGRFVYSHAADSLQAQPHRPYSQPRYFNPLNGGVQRDFAPLTEAIVRNEVVQRVLRRLGATFSELEDQPRWRVNTFFTRIVTRDGETGRPVPEGRHRDGVRFSCLLMANSIAYTGGHTTLFDILTHAPIFRCRLDAPGRALVFRDDAVLHDTSAIHPDEPHATGIRDVLSIEFY
jgi:hypothetical protein